MMRFEFIFGPHFFYFFLDYSFFIAIFAISKMRVMNEDI